MSRAFCAAVRGLARGLGERRVGVDGGREAASGRRPLFMASTSSCTRSPARSATIVAPRMRSPPFAVRTLTKPSSSRSTHRAVHLAERAGPHVVGDAPGPGLGLVQARRGATSGEVNVHQGSTRGVRFAEPGQQDVADDGARVVVGHVRELVAAGDVARRVDVRLRGPQAGVHASRPSRRGRRRPPRGPDPRCSARGPRPPAAPPPPALRRPSARPGAPCARAPPLRGGPAAPGRPVITRTPSASSRAAHGLRRVLVLLLEDARRATSTIVTSTPSRAKAWPSSHPMGPPPSTIIRVGPLAQLVEDGLVRVGPRLRQALDRAGWRRGCRSRSRSCGRAGAASPAWTSRGETKRAGAAERRRRPGDSNRSCESCGAIRGPALAHALDHAHRGRSRGSWRLQAPARRRAGSGRPARAEAMRALLGTQPVFRQSPPMRCALHQRHAAAQRRRCPRR